MPRLLIILSALIVASASLGAESMFPDAAPGRAFSFPQDHGKHPDFQTEWWYFTGNLDSPDGGKWGFQLTFFRRSMVREPRRNSAWAVRDVYPAHFAITDIKNRAFFHTEIISRQGPGLAGATADDLNVHVRDWSAQRQDDVIHLRAREGEYALKLELSPEKPPALHGASGYSRKGDSDEQASYYYSFTRLKAEGTVTFKGAFHTVSGLAWMDHEFGSSILLPDQAGWDWFSLQLEDGTDIMVFHLRKRDGGFERPFGTVVPEEGPAIDLAGKQISIKPTGSWTSPHTGATYPSGWGIEIPDLQLSLEVKPLLEDQELSTDQSTRIVYWEGAVEVTGLNQGKMAKGRGYVELTGYAHSVGGQL